MPTRRARRLRAVRATPDFRIPATLLSRVTIWLAGGYGLVQGVIICLSSPARWADPSFSTLRTMPGAPYTWGVSVALFGAIVLVGSLTRMWWVKAAGMVLLSSWCLVFGARSLSAIILDPTASTTGPATYFLLGLWVAILTWVDEGPRHESHPPP